MEALEKGEREETGIANPMWRLYAEYGRANAGRGAVGVIGTIVARLFGLVPAFVVGLTIDAVFLSQREYGLPLVPDGWLPADPAGQLWASVAVLLAATMLGAAATWTQNWGWNSFAQRVQHALRVDTYDRMQLMEMRFFDDRQTGELMSVLNNDVNQLESFLNDGVSGALRIGAVVVGIGAVMVALDPRLAAIALLPVPLLAGFTYAFVRIIQPKYAAMRASVGALNSRLENNLGGIDVIKSEHAEAFESDRVEQSSLGYFGANWAAIRTRILFFPGLGLIAGVGFAITFAVGGFWVFAGTLSAGAFVTFVIYTQQFIWPMAQFGQIINEYQRAKASSARIYGLMNEPGYRVESDEGAELVVREGRVEFDGVSFAYDDREVLSGIDLEARGGETVGIVGPTGAGKSTLADLLVRIYDPDAGTIRIDGQDLREVSLRSLRRSVGYVSQEPFLFYGTVRENIAYGTFEASDGAVVEAARAAQAHEFIRNLPEGYETMVGERGVKLSGGQRQRISIARTVLKDPAVLVLDEATSHVDTETEALIRRSLDELTADRTTFAIAHRLSTIRDADVTVVLDEGRIAERGTHEELLAAEGTYANFWRVQAGEIDELPREFIERAIERGSRIDAGIGSE
ncbi:ABC transporter ATP-binding protein [Halalkalicoccus sp. GCM10025322]|uniref:ABC transporter ATP-binding protein n=1 Tax=Halalkalicoccus TaxID=332246 RepID=UPI002F96CB30